VTHKINVFHEERFFEAFHFFVDFTTAEEPLVAVGEPNTRVRKLPHLEISSSKGLEEKRRA